MERKKINRNKKCIKNFNNRIGKHIVLDMSYSSDNELINKDGTVDKLIVLDRLTKKKVVKDVNELIIRIYKNIKNDEEREIIENYIRSTLSELITSEQLDEIIKKVNKEK